MSEQDDALQATYFVDSDDAAIIAKARTLADGATDDVQIAERLFYAVRDGFRYDPYNLATEREAFKASNILGETATWCVPKSIVLTAMARASGIPARLGFADVRNHLTSEKLTETMGTDLFAWHGYSELWLDGRWVKLSTAFNKELCDRFGVKALEFDPVEGALMHPFDESGRRHMEYVRERGSYLDLPLADMFRTFAEVYPGWEIGPDGEATRVDVSPTSKDERFH
ncbi:MULTISPECIES: transglutaminase-like domain-containing protein [Hyphomonas]|uniref:Transglutaminase n=1 Tax=Hyphomonas adhaerens TaxID=81029 RepID=A0A3B9GWB8_9PROT|nr:MULTISPECIES: transglutaminase family protein [Hyphomonas]MBB40750.1 transglutaminase [Hyphomonas sp.]HAE26668.1 transglutaminase [Hyphomonas adhaerens]|tara:strand:- start:101 stop:781 length:681 start_codon:yes stop_codon:yes gene_type:complete